MDTFSSNPKILEYLEEKVAKAEKPDKPVVFAGPKGYSYRQLLNEVRTGTEIGRNFYHSMELILELDATRKARIG
jgi:hypothetical protein